SISSNGSLSLVSSAGGNSAPKLEVPPDDADGDYIVIHNHSYSPQPEEEEEEEEDESELVADDSETTGCEEFVFNSGAKSEFIDYFMDRIHSVDEESEEEAPHKQLVYDW